MSLLQESYVYILLLPVTLQILLPLAILVVRLVCLPFLSFSDKREEEGAPIEEMHPA